MAVLFDSFQEWADHLAQHPQPLWQAVLEYEVEQKGRTPDQIWAGVATAYAVMQDAVNTGLTQEMNSLSGMIHGGARLVQQAPVSVLGPSFQLLIARTLAAKEVNSCMGRVVAAPTAGASGIMPGVLVHLQDVHQLPPETVHQALLVAAGIALIIERRAGISGAVGGCQAETGTAAAMGAGAIVFSLGGTPEQVFTAVAITIMNMLGLICDPVAGLVEVPCVKRNASGAVIAYCAAQMALAGYDPVIPVDEVIDVMGEVGHSLEARYKETALGGLAASPTGRAIAQRVLVADGRIVATEEDLTPEHPQG